MYNIGMKQISVQSFKEVVDAESANPSVDFINVCTPAEYKEKSIAGVRNVPLDEIEQHADEFANKKTIYVHCLSGKRGARAVEKLSQMGIEADLVNVEGGIMAWEEAGYEMASTGRVRIPIMRQVLLTAGILVLLGHILAHTGFTWGQYIVVLVGIGLSFAGATGWCGMAKLLGLMPWNK